jgi:hypothetical protein
MLMRNERLAQLDTRYDDPTHTLVIRHEGREVARGDLSTEEGGLRSRRSSAASCARNCAVRRRCSTPMATASLTSPRRWFDHQLASVAAIETAVGVPVHPLRFRANLYVTAGRPGTSSACLGRRSRSAMRGSR